MVGSSFDPIRLPDEVWRAHTADLQARDVGALFRLARKYAGASQNRISAATGIPQSRVNALMNNRSGPVSTLEMFERVADGLNLPDHARASLGLAAGSSTSAGRQLSVPAHRGGGPADQDIPSMVPALDGDRFSSVPRDHDLPHHHTWGMAWERNVITMSAHESIDHASQAGAALAEETLHAAREQVIALARSYAATPPLALHQHAVQVRALLYRLIERTRRPAQVADLYVMAGQVCGLMAAATFDLGYFPAATEQARAAFAYGEAAGHNGVRAYARGLQAVIAYWDRRPREAVELTRSAARYAGSGTSGTRLACVRARAWSYLGAEVETTAAIQDATAARHTDEPDDDMYDTIGGEFGFSRAREHNWYGTALLTLGDHTAAAEHSTRTLELLAASAATEQPHREPGLEAYARTDLATAHLLIGDIEQATDTLTPLWDIPDAERRSALTGRLAAMSDVLTGTTWRGNREAGELRDRLETYRADAALTRALPAGPQTVT